jgi:putative ATP-binding cassette transporter
MEINQKRSSLRAAWHLVAPYWISEDKWRAWGLLIAVVVLNLISVAVSVRINLWNRDFFNAIQEFDFPEFRWQLLIFAGLAVTTIALTVYQVYLQQMLQIRWRRWLTRRYLDTWLGGHAYYRLQLLHSDTDNPDQRISDDLDRFTTQTLSLAVGTQGFLNASVTLLSFLSILWTLSGSVTLPLGPLGWIEISGYMVWFALIYAAGSTWFTFRIGRPLVNLNFAQQRFEADFRFSMMRLRENSESVAFYGGENRERGIFLERFHFVVDNFWSIMKRTKRLNWYTSGYDQFAVVFPYLVASPRYFAKKITFGILQQTADAFGQVQQSLSFMVSSYTAIAEWQSVVQRLDGFNSRARAVAMEGDQRLRIERAGDGISVVSLDLELPGREILQHDLRFEVAAGEWLLITAPAGSGKSTLLRALAGVWPFGSGNIRIGEGRMLFLPQRPYIPLGTLRGALLYPNEDKKVLPQRLAAVLAEVGLGNFARDLEALDNWAQRLSPGEQQRLAFARILLSKPAFIFLDEATSSLDEASEAELYVLLRKALWKPTVVSVGHRTTLNKFHDRMLILPKQWSR